MENNLEQSVFAIREYLNKAINVFYEEMSYSRYENSTEIIEAYIEHAFIELLVLLDSEGLERTYNDVKEIFNKAKTGRGGLSHSLMGEEDPYLVWPGIISNYLTAVANINNIRDDNNIIQQNLLDSIRHSIYSITDNNVFANPPQNEKEVHYRIESILKCYYPDLIHAPSLSKPIKNFIPDTGIPSLKVLIEYKYISNANEAKRIVDELLTDTQAYKSAEPGSSLQIDILYRNSSSLTIEIQKAMQRLNLQKRRC